MDDTLSYRPAILPRPVIRPSIPFSLSSVKSVGSPQLEPPASPGCRAEDQFQCWAPQKLLSRSRWFDYYLAAPRTRAPAAGQPAGTEPTPRGAYLLRVIRTDLDEPRRWQAIDRISRRLLAAEAFHHPQAVPVLDAEVDRAPFFVVEPFIPGLALSQWRDAEQESCTLSRVIWTLRQIAELINAAHDHERVHLGLAPQHLLVGPDGKVMLTGWCQTHQVQQRTWLPVETVEDLLCLAPEVALPAYRAQTASDVYAWGVLAYWLLSGRWPFEIDSVESLQAAHRQQIPVELQVVQPSCPGPLNQLVNQALAKNPLRRPASKFLLDCLISIEIDHLHDQRRMG